MPANLTPEQLAWLMSQIGQPAGGSGYSGQVQPHTLTSANGSTYHPTFTGGSGGVEQGYEAPTLTGWMRDAVAGRNEEGDMQEMYAPGGAYQGTAAIPDYDADNLALLSVLAAPFAAAAAGLGAGAAGAAGAGAGGMSAAEAFALSDAVYGGSALSAGQLGATGSLFGGAAGAAGAAGAGGGATGTMGAFSSGLTPITGTVPGFTAAAGGGLLSSLGAAGSALGGIGSALGGMGPLIGSLVGAGLGSQPTTTQRDEVRRMDPRLDARVFGEGGFLDQADAFRAAHPTGMNQAMTDANAMRRGLLNDPATLQGFRDIASQGQGLMSAGIAANPFANGRPVAESLFSQNARRPQRPGLLGQIGQPAGYFPMMDY